MASVLNWYVKICLMSYMVLAVCTALATPFTAPVFEKLTNLSDTNLIFNSAIQDRQGYLWFGTSNGILRFDGYNYVTYKINFGESPYLERPIYNLFEDKQGRIWACTDNGLALLDPVTNTFNRPVFATTKIFSQPANQLISDMRGGMWLATRDGLTNFNPDSGFIREYRHDPTNADSLKTNNIKALAMDDQGGLWVATWPGGIDYLAVNATSFKHFRVDTPSHPDALLNNVRTLLFDQQHRLWMGTEADIVLWQEGVDWSQRKHLAVNSGTSRIRVSKIYQDNNAAIWVGTSGHGLLRWDSDKFISYPHRAENPNSLPSNEISSIFVDRTDALWVSLNAAGLYRANLGIQGLWPIIPRDLAKSTPEQSNLGFSIACDTRNRVWLGGVKGLALIDVAKSLLSGRF
jgi:ligand-binding sensor domain-containing protein